MAEDGIHLSWNGYRDPVAQPGELSANGNQLRGFLSVCKILEVKQYIYDGINPPPGKEDPPSISTATLPDGQVGQPYQCKLEAAGGTAPYRWNAVTIPAGLKLSREGELTGAPKRAGALTLTVTVTDAKGQAGRKTFKLTVN
jgi:hypothetical protein